MNRVVAGVLDALRRFWRGPAAGPPPPEPDPEPLEANVDMEGLLCECPEEWCFCTRTIYVPVALLTDPRVRTKVGACSDCMVGRHVYY